jgi:hypothetical protein
MAAKTFVAAAVNSTDGTSRTFAGHSIGNASGKVNPKILVAVATTYLNDAPWSGSGVEITWAGLSGSITMEKLYMPKLSASTGDTGVCGWFMCDHPGGAITTADITITVSGGNKEGWGIATWILEDADYWQVSGRQFAQTATSPDSLTLAHGSGDFLFCLHQHGRTTDRYATFASGTGGAGPTTTITMGRNSATAGVTLEGGGTMDTNTNTGSRTRMAAIALHPIGTGSNPSALPPGDPYWSNVVLLVQPHDQYAPAITGISDLSLSAHGALTFSNNTQIQNNLVADDNASISVDGVNDRWFLPDSNDWQLGATSADPWTVELRIVSIGANGYILNQSQSGIYSWALTLASGVLGFIGYNGTTQWTITCSHTGLVGNQRYEIAVDHDATGKVRVYLDGVMVGSGTPANSAIHNGTGNIYGGTDLNFAQDWQGCFGGVRITKGVARYASDSGYTLGHANGGGAPPYPAYALLDTIASITPALGNNGGGTAVTVDGIGFTGATQLLIGGNACTSFVVVDDFTITAVTPSGSIGFADVVVDRPTTDLTLAYGFEYIAATPPVVMYLTPGDGPATGGDVVIVTGTDLTGATGAELGGVAVTGFSVLDPFTAVFTTPASATIGAKSFELFHPYGDYTLPNAYVYLPAISAISPNEGPAEGGTAVTITGIGLTDAVDVLFNGVPATSVVVVNSTTITAVTPVSAVTGLADVLVTFSGDDADFPYGFDYYSCLILYITPDLGTNGTTVIITGLGFSDATGVLVNGIPADNFAVIDGHEITFDMPDQGSGFLGLVDVVVQHPLGDVELPYGLEYLAPQAVISQIPINVVDVPLRPARISQIPVDVVYVPQKPGSVSQIPITAVFPLEPVPPDALLPVWPVEEVWSWKTTIVKTISGREQRMAVRREPWQSFSYQLAIFDDVDRQTMLYILWRHSGRRLSYPLFVYRVNITATASIGDTVIEADLSLGNFREGEAVAIFNADLTFYMVLETSAFASPSGVILAAPLEVEIAEGLMMAPAPTCRIDDQNSFSMATHNGRSDVTFTPVATRELLRPGQTATVDTFDGLPILLEKYVVENVEEQLNRNIETLSNDIQTPRDFRSWYYPQINTQRTFIVDEAETLDFWREFGDTIKGSRGAFLIPSYRNDFTLNAVPALNQTLLTTDDTYVADYFRSASNRYLRLETANGVVFRKVIDVILNMDRTATIVLGTALGNVAGDNVISKISIIYKVRLTDDRITLRHMPNYVELQMNVSTVEK